MNVSDTFRVGDPLGDGVRWMLKTVVLAGVIVGGLVTGFLQATVNAVIVGFTLIQGVMPYVKVTMSIRTDRYLNRRAVEELQYCEVELFDLVGTKKMEEEGLVYQCMAAIKRMEGRLPREIVTERFLEVARQNWYAMLLPVETAAQLLPTLGLGGSILGILGMLAAGAADSAVQASMATMFSSTLAGCTGSFLLSGLAANARGWIDRHVASVEMIVSLLLDGKDPNGTETDDYEPMI